MQKFDTKTFQGLILTLQDYWARQGCTIVQPLDMEVGAGTSHPMTSLRALGPEPMATAYVQPSRRPTDGRYGENPNRLRVNRNFDVAGDGDWFGSNTTHRGFLDVRITGRWRRALRRLSAHGRFGQTAHHDWWRRCRCPDRPKDVAGQKLRGKRDDPDGTRDRYG